MSVSKKKCRQYHIEYMSLICQRVFTNETMKPSRLQEHLFKMEADKKDKDLSYFQILKEKYFKQPTASNLFESTTK